MREPSWSLVPVAKCGLRRVAPCHQRVFSGPPPPRLVGLYAIFVCACATPADASICAAMGAVRPRPIMALTKWRRLIVPARTLAIIDRSSRSSIELLLDHVRSPSATGHGRRIPRGHRPPRILLVGRG